MSKILFYTDNTIYSVCIAYNNNTYWYHVLIDEKITSREQLLSRIKSLFDNEINVSYTIECVYTVDLHDATETACIYDRDRDKIDL